MSRTAVKEKSRNASTPLSGNEHLLRWVDKMPELMRPESIHWVPGSRAGDGHRLDAAL
jgi:hypothetical protein